MTLPQHLREAARAHPDKPAFVCGDAVLRYGELLRQAQALAGRLQRRHGLARGHRVLLAGANHPRFAVAVQALWAAGAVVVPVNPTSTAAEVDWLAADSGARLALVDESLLPRLAACGAGLACLPLPAELAAAMAEGTPPRGLPAPDDFCLLAYTSGTTGRPKGCMHTQATLTASLRSSARWRGFDAGTVFLGNTPLFHMQGFQNGMNLPLMLGATSVMQPRWNPEEAAALIERHRIAAWSAAPTMLVDLFASPAALRHDLSCLRLVSGGGAALPEPVAQALQERLGLVYNEAYGMTETASFLHANPVGGGRRGCLGLATDGVDSRIVDPETGAELPHGDVGELVTHAPQVMLRYWCEGLQPQANEGAFLHIDGKRFLRTGDLARRDAKGYFFLRDRLKRMINSAGFKVWPAEVEAVLHRHPAVQEACVIAMRDARRGEAVKAVVVRRPGHVLDAAQLIAWAREAMAPYKAPSAVEFRRELPRLPTGKTAWRELQAQQREIDNPGDTACTPRLTRRHVLAGLGAALGAPGAWAQATAWPTQPIRIVVPYPAGGATDALARLVAAGLQQAWGQTVVVDNKPGASGTIGNDAVVKALPDGYTVLMAITALIQQPPLMKLPYDPLRDLQPVSEVARINSALAVPATAKESTLKEFIAMVKANPGKVSFGSYGIGTSSHIQGSLLNVQAGLDMVHVPYKGSAPLLTDLMGGQLPAAFVDISSAAPHLKGGKFKALAVTGTARSKLLPEVPTLQELGLHSFEPYGWFGLLMPAGTPPAVVQKFSAEVGRVLHTAEAQAKTEALGVIPVGNTPEQFGQSLRHDAQLYAKIIKDTKITLE